MKKILPVIIAGSMLVVACKNNDSSTENGSYDSSIVTTPQATSNTINTDSNTNVVPATAQTGQSITLPAPGATTPTPAPVTTTTAPGMNPPHGQPGHRCDIAVGAPLNSAPAKPAAITSTTQPAVTATPASAAAPVKTAPGMNPPHGQPGHRCDIAVGAPLNSAPAKTTTPAKTATESKTATLGATPPAVNIVAADTSAKQ